MMENDQLRFPLVTFQRVFDTEPIQEELTLQELTRVLRRFELRTRVQRRIEREVGRIEALAQRFLDGEEVMGRQATKIRRAARSAREEGGEVEAAVAACAGQMKDDVARQSKKELRIWSPALYRPGAPKRGGDHVTHVSCLVLDYDDGSTIQQASEVWSSWYHIVHSTWSHSAALHKFRLILPLARPVPAPHWREVWKWAEEFSGCVIDAACKSPASTYALPALPREDWPREAFTRAGPLLDPVFEELVPEEPEPPPVQVSPEAYMVQGDPEAVYVLHDPGSSPAGQSRSDDDDDEMWDLWSDSTSAPPGTLPASDPDASSSLTMEQVVRRLEALEQRVEQLARLISGK